MNLSKETRGREPSSKISLGLCFWGVGVGRGRKMTNEVLLRNVIKTPKNCVVFFIVGGGSLVGFVLSLHILVFAVWKSALLGLGRVQRPPSSLMSDAVCGQGEKSHMKSCHSFSSHGNQYQNQILLTHAWLVWSDPMCFCCRYCLSPLPPHL